MASNVYTVANTQELYQALETVGAGDVIKLQSGNYGDVNISNLSFLSEVVLTSADQDNPAVFNSINAANISNVSFDGLFFDFVPDQDTVEWDSALKVTNSSSVTIRNSVFEGGVSVAGIPWDSAPGEQGREGILGEPIGRGMTFGWSSGIVLENNDVSKFTKGIVINDIDQLTIRQNEIYDLRSSPLTGTVGSNITIEENYFHSSRPWNLGGEGDHGDYVHLWTVPGQSTPSSDIVIRNNVFSEGDGESLLGVYLDDNTNNIGFENVLIEGNVINVGDSQAIRFENVNGAEVVRNTLLKSSGDANDTPGVILESSSNINVAENVMARDVRGVAPAEMAARNISVSDNLVVQYEYPSEENYFGDLFINSKVAGAELANFRAVPGGPADGVGSPLTQFSASYADLMPSFQVNSVPGDARALVFDASLTFGPGGQVDPATAVFSWSFGDGTKATGPVVQRSFDAPGRYDVTLKVETGNGTTEIASYTVAIAGDRLLAFDGATGTFFNGQYGDVLTLDATVEDILQVGNSVAIRLGEQGTAASVAKEGISQLFSADNYDINFSLVSTAGPASAGEVFRIHGNLTVSVDAGGNLVFEAFPVDGSRPSVATTGVSLTDGQPHDISIRYLGEQSSFEIRVDGQLEGALDLGADMPYFPRDLTFGNPWGSDNFDGYISQFEVKSEHPEYSPFSGNPAAVNTNVVEDHTSQQAIPANAMVLDIAGLANDPDFLHGDAAIISTAQGPAITFDGDMDRVKLGKLEEFQDTSKLSVAIEFKRSEADGEEHKVFWNKNKIGLKLDDDGLVVRVGGADGKFKAFRVDDLGLNDTELHRAVVMVDDVTDRLQVLIDGALVLDETQTDFDLSVSGDKAWNWMFSGFKKRFFEGEISDFRIEASADFVDDDTAPTDIDLLL